MSDDVKEKYKTLMSLSKERPDLLGKPIDFFNDENRDIYIENIKTINSSIKSKRIAGKKDEL